MLKQLLGLDKLHWTFLFFGLAVAALVFMLWYPELIGSVGWERGEYITIDSLIARIIGSLIVSSILWLLLILGFWLLLRKTSRGKRQYHEDKQAIIDGIIWVVNFVILPKVIEIVQFGFWVGLLMPE